MAEAWMTPVNPILQDAVVERGESDYYRVALSLADMPEDIRNIKLQKMKARYQKLPFSGSYQLILSKLEQILEKR